MSTQKTIVSFAQDGLVERARLNKDGFDESVFLAPLHESLASGKTPAENMLTKYHEQWDEDISRVFKEYAF